MPECFLLFLDSQQNHSDVSQPKLYNGYHSLLVDVLGVKSRCAVWNQAVELWIYIHFICSVCVFRFTGLHVVSRHRVSGRALGSADEEVPSENSPSSEVRPLGLHLPLAGKRRHQSPNIPGCCIGQQRYALTTFLISRQRARYRVREGERQDFRAGFRGSCFPLHKFKRWEAREREGLPIEGYPFPLHVSYIVLSNYFAKKLQLHSPCLCCCHPFHVLILLALGTVNWLTQLIGSKSPEIALRST